MFSRLSRCIDFLHAHYCSEHVIRVSDINLKSKLYVGTWYLYRFRISIKYRNTILYVVLDVLIIYGRVQTITGSAYDIMFFFSNRFNTGKHCAPISAVNGVQIIWSVLFYFLNTINCNEIIFYLFNLIQYGHLPRWTRGVTFWHVIIILILYARASGIKFRVQSGITLYVYT